MNPVTIAVGVMACSYAIWVLILRLQGKNEKFHKLEPMKKFWGPRLGSLIHYLGYVGAPFAFGISLIFAGFKGVNLLAVLAK